jgi:parallel beta-helix repeat protein
MLLPLLNFTQTSGSTISGQTPTTPFRIVVLPDTQGYTRYLPEIFDKQTQWIVDNKDAQNIAFVVQLGDLVDEPLNITQWQCANHSLSKLDGIVPYSVLPGNHDQKDSNFSLFNQFFGASRFDQNSWYSGTYNASSNADNYEVFTAGGTQYLMLNLEYNPNDDVLYWANGVIDAHPDCKVIVSTHDYLMGFLRQGQRSDTGERIWNTLVKPHADQVMLVLCGHAGGEDSIVDNVDGHIVYQMLTDYANDTFTQKGWMRILEFNPDQNSVSVKTYSPLLNQYKTGAKSEFTLDLNAAPTPPPKPSIMSNKDAIYILPDGSIQPPTAPIKRDGDVYTFEANILGALIVERDHAVIDGAGFTLSGSGTQDTGPWMPPFDESRRNDTDYTRAYYSAQFNLPDEYFRSESKNTGIYSYAQGITVRNLKVTDFWCGIELEYASDNILDHNQIVGNNQAVWIHGSLNNTITNNVISDNQNGLELMSSHDRIVSNIITNSSDCAIELQWSFNTLKANTITSARNAIRLASSIRNTFQSNQFSQVDSVFDCSNWQYPNGMQNVDTSNMLEHRPLIYWVNKQGASVPQDAGWVALVGCSNMKVEGLNLTQGGIILLSETTNSVVANNTLGNCTDGIKLDHADGNKVAVNTLTDCYDGIHLQASSSNNLTANTLTRCNDGITLRSAHDNTIRLNTAEKGYYGIRLFSSANNLVGSNQFSDNNQAVVLEGAWGFQIDNPKMILYPSTNNTITGNEIKNNNAGVTLQIAKNNLIASNNFEDNAVQAEIQTARVLINSNVFFVNKWDNGSVGNYWNDYVDKYPNGGVSGNSWNKPYNIDDRNQDRHPLTQPATFEVPPQKEANQDIAPLALVLASIAAFAALGLVGYTFFARKNRAI